MKTASAVKSVAIIGAGWSGLQIMKVLLDCGYDVTVFEGLDDVGGTWHPDNAYVGLTLHMPMFRCQFHEFDRTANRDPLQRLASQDVQSDCRAYVEQHQLERHINLGARVVRIDYDSTTRRSTLSLSTQRGSAIEQRAFDLVVSTQFATPRIPSFAGQASFDGQILHSSHVKSSVFEDVVRAGKRVVVLGASKSGSDMAYAFAKRNYRATWLFRRMYWYFSYDKGYFDFQKGRPASRFYRLLYCLGILFARTPRLIALVFGVWRLAGLIRCPGRKHSDYTKFHQGWLDESQIRTLETRTTQVEGEIDHLERDGIVLRSGERIPCDVLVCATGCDPIAAPITLAADGIELAYADVKHVYRYSVIPQLPRLCFTGYWMFGSGPTNAFARAAWIIRYLERDLASDELEAVAAREAPPDGKLFFARSNALFDSSRNVFTTLFEGTRRMMEGLYSKKDAWRYLFAFGLHHRFHVMEGVERFIAARRTGRSVNSAEEASSIGLDVPTRPRISSSTL
jgi:cation diffusion facilitator CzcD-associated flavoprotein CzcO